jgi:hypothetical protein
VRGLQYKCLLVALGILLVPLSLWSNSLFYSPSDTLILDGDTIFIERDQIAVSADSIPSNGNSVKLKRIPSQIGSIAFAAGLNATFPRVFDTDADYRSLNHFTSSGYSPRLNSVFSIDAAAQFLTIKSSFGDIELSAAAGGAFNSVQFNYSTLADPDQLNVDSILSFKSENQDFYLEHFVSTKTPEIGEVDTVYLVLQDAAMKFNSRDVSLKLRTSLNRSRHNVRLFIEAGVVRKMLSKKTDTPDIFFFTDDGRWSSVSANTIESTNLLMPVFALGMERKMPFSSWRNRASISMGASLVSSFPAVNVVREEFISIDVFNTSLNVYGRLYF